MFRYADRIADSIGIDPKKRQLNLETLYLSTEKTPAAYWLQLMVAAGIAHMGLVLDSTAVLIGAMLVSPLMTPIVQVAMGFAIGHLHLTLRAMTRLAMSIFVVVLFAAAMTHMMPVQEATREILGRTAPTFLDLIVALLCGLAASFTSARGSKDTVTAAAGTAIAIALVPPLCVVGFGVGMLNPDIAFGAGLLFTANLASIILCGDVFFLLTGFSSVDMERLEQRIYSESDRGRPLYRLAKSLPVPGSISRSLWLRLLLPGAFVTVVSMPLSTALSQVVWEVRVKEKIDDYLAKVEKSQEVLARRLTVRPDVVTLRMSVVGDPDEKDALQQTLTNELAAKAGVVPTVHLQVVPSDEAVRRRLQRSSARLAEQFANSKSEPEPAACPPAGPSAAEIEAIKSEAATAAAKTARAEGAAEAVAALPNSHHVDALRAKVGAVLTWAAPKPPADCAWLGWSLGVGSEGTVLRLRLLADQPLAPGLDQMLATVITRETGLPLAAVRVRRQPRTLVHAPADAPDAVHLPALRDALRRVKRAGLTVQATVPDPSGIKKRRARAAVEARNADVRAALGDVQPKIGDAWSVVVDLPPADTVQIATQPPPAR